MTTPAPNTLPGGDGAVARAGRRTLVTGGVRSGKSTHAEHLLWNQPTTYLATGPARPDDAEWVRRVEAHRRRRPALWRSVESADAAAALVRIDGPCLLDDIGSWLTAALGESGAWGGLETETASDEADAPDEAWRVAYAERADALVDAVAAFAHDLVIVTNEVGFGLVSPYHSGRVFTDELGRLNQRLARVCDDVVLVVAGCPLVIKGQASTEPGVS